MYSENFYELVFFLLQVERTRSRRQIDGRKMGTQLSVSVHDYTHPEEAPRTDRPPTFDPLAGFPAGRKKREMKATWEEMDAAQLNAGERDYCAHLLINFKDCQVGYLECILSAKLASKSASYYSVNGRHLRATRVHKYVTFTMNANTKIILYASKNTNASVASFSASVERSKLPGIDALCVLYD